MLTPAGANRCQKFSQLPRLVSVNCVGTAELVTAMVGAVCACCAAAPVAATARRRTIRVRVTANPAHAACHANPLIQSHFRHARAAPPFTAATPLSVSAHSPIEVGYVASSRSTTPDAPYRPAPLQPKKASRAGASGETGA